jgi:hypothetical protein
MPRKSRETWLVGEDTLENEFLIVYTYSFWYKRIN